MKAKRIVAIMAVGVLGFGVLMGVGGCGDKTAGENENATEEETDAEKQARTVADIRNVGAALFSFLTDQLAGSEGQGPLAGATLVSFLAAQDSGPEPAEGLGTKGAADGPIPEVSFEQIERWLHPSETRFYIKRVPKVDGWGRPIRYQFRKDNILASRIMRISSAGKDGKFQAEPYDRGEFDPEDYDQDVVWEDGYFIRWPSGAGQQKKD